MIRNEESGIAMVSVMVMMIAIALFGAVVMNMGGLEQRIAGNFQLLAESFEVSEAGVRGSLSLAENDTANPFQGPNATLGGVTLIEDPDQLEANEVNPIFTSTDPIASVAGKAGLDLGMHLVVINTQCPRSETPSSSFVSECDFYRLNSHHRHAGTGVAAGVTLHVVEEVTPSN